MSEWKGRLERLGMLYPVSAGIQIDINAAVRHHNGLTSDGSLCDHNCTMEGGNYICPAAVSLNRGFVRKSFAPADILLRGIQTAIEGLKLANQELIRSALPTHFAAFRVPPEVASALTAGVGSDMIEVNLFGGNPEMHSEIITIIAELRRRSDVVINFTTTGRRLMRDHSFAEQIMETPPDIIALSADDFEDAEQIYRLHTMPLEALYTEWKSIPWTHGQRQKAIEAIYTARLLAGKAQPAVLFNLVIHSANVNRVVSIVTALAESFPGCRINPFPSQTAFMYQPGDMGDLASFERIVDWMIAAHHDQTLPVTRRLHYWLALKAACQVNRSNPSMLADAVGGAPFWQCYKSFGANRYLQIGKSSGTHHKTIGGGHLGCFWNDETITRSDVQVWDMTSREVTDFLREGATALAANSSKACPGCAFPRLLFDVLSTEAGLANDLIPAYLKLRQSHVGY
ncbi:hypothetical protein K2Z83_03100 [Oscillochloris sp. ZM17-4]|uniref:radical SAM protein n=1 Tax=Oscillochloris sp. ZM17-4 TaxID=2866714 RepID=UPI001C7333C9|nr:radical SAM protein [Oscillochloris sp. ZM17-4]MBX0326670.1 hypothetical protein [Oscillochloris sp. ZM17-4]